MALVTLMNENRTFEGEDQICACLKSFGIDYERWTPSHPVAQDAPAEEILRAYSREVEELKAKGGYVTADVIDVDSKTPGLEEMLAKFNREHWHDEDEVRFIISGRGLFHICDQERRVAAIEVEAGDLIRVPRGTKHWFNLCADRRIRAIRLFQDTSGWTPHYTNSDVDKNYLPLCFGGSQVLSADDLKSYA
jgi:1,2-dihydroxy-3-keto-5-methylthiopentene dioxygenase